LPDKKKLDQDGHHKRNSFMQSHELRCKALYTLSHRLRGDKTLQM